MMADYLTDKERADVEQWANTCDPLLPWTTPPPKHMADYILKLLRELEDLKAELFNGMSERFRESDVRARRQARIIAVAKEALRTIAEIEGEK